MADAVNLEAFQALAAASRGRKRRGWGGEYRTYSTADLERDLCSPSMDKETRAKIEAEVARRRSYKK